MCQFIPQAKNIYTEILNTCFSIPCRETQLQEGYAVVKVNETLQCEWAFTASLLLFTRCHYMIYISMADRSKDQLGPGYLAS